MMIDIILKEVIGWDKKIPNPIQQMGEYLEKLMH
jgi:hypothetical protein